MNGQVTALLKAFSDFPPSWARTTLACSVTDHHSNVFFKSQPTQTTGFQTNISLSIPPGSFILGALCCSLRLDHSFLTLQKSASSQSSALRAPQQGFLWPPNAQSAPLSLPPGTYTHLLMLCLFPTLNCNLLESKFPLLITSIFSVLRASASTRKALSKHLCMNQSAIIITHSLIVQDCFL